MCPRPHYRFARWRDRRRARRAMLWLLRRPDEHYLRDIGLTREELRQLIGHWAD